MKLLNQITQLQLIAIAVSLLFFSLIVFLIQRKRIKEEYSLLWLFVSIVFIVFSFWREGLDFLAQSMGVSYPPAALFLILLVAVFLILIEFSIIISKLSDRNKTLTQEIGILKQEVLQLQKDREPYQEADSDSYSDT